MVRLRVLGLCVMGVLAVSAALAAVASAEAPEMGRCKKEATKTHTYANVGCTKLATKPGTGSYEWYPGAGPKNKFTGVGGVGTLETVSKATVVCKTEASSGEFTSPKTAGNIEVKFTGCESAGNVCDTQHAAAGEIVTNLLAGTVRWENKALKKAALDLVPQETELFVEFNCGPANVKVKGSVLTNVKTGTMETKVVMKFTAKNGKQKPEYYETASGEKVKDVLESKLGAPPFEQAGQTITNTQTDEEALEVNWFV